MINKIQNRKFPVFFISKSVIICLLLLSVIGCKSKTDWRDNYNKNKNKKEIKKTTNHSKTIAKPYDLSEISKILDVSESSLKNKNLYNFIIDWYGTPYKYGGNNQNGIEDRKSTRLNSSHVKISYAVFCLKKKKKI